MSDFLTELPYGWWIAFLIVATVLIYLADAYDQNHLPRARANLDPPVRSELEAVDAEAWIDQREIEREFSADIEGWLKARNTYEAGQS